MAHQIIKLLSFRFLALLLGISFIASSCYYDKEDVLYENYYAQNQCDTVNVSFSNDIMPIIQGNCATTGCHVQGGSGPGIFVNYNGMMEKVNNGSFEKRVLIEKNMPPSAPLSDCQQAIIRAWLKAGAPNN